MCRYIPSARHLCCGDVVAEVDLDVGERSFGDVDGEGVWLI